MQFVDQCTISLKAGNGGNGVVSWRREAHYPEGGPWGGDGGNGGDIIFIGDHNKNTLFDIRNLKHIKAQDGENGKTKMAFGLSGEHKYIHVPLGTSIYDAQTNELIVDILKTGQQHVVCAGGRGGHGNAFFKTSLNRTPTAFENGDLGEEKKVVLKLKYIADVGLVGLPNAGKSSLINSLSNTRSRVANYQFTTLIPVLGAIKKDDVSLVIADIPGLIEGASEGKGLGHEFLKHIERCDILIHMISLSDLDAIDPYESYQTINNELKKYSAQLLDKEIILVANKIDLEESKEKLAKLKKQLKKDIIEISVNDKTNLDVLLKMIFNKHEKITLENNKILSDQDEVSIIEIKKQKDPNKNLIVTKIDDHLYEAKSEYLSYWSHKIPLTTVDNNNRFRGKLKAINFDEQLKKHGAKTGDVVLINEIEFILE